MSFSNYSWSCGSIICDLRKCIANFPRKLWCHQKADHLSKGKVALLPQLASLWQFPFCFSRLLPNRFDNDLESFCWVYKNCRNKQRSSSRFFQEMTKADARRVTTMLLKEHGIEGMAGSLDCMHVKWKNCPVAWQGQYQGKECCPTIVMEVFCDFNLWF